ncbi:MAG: TonB family protein [Gammaproteobacteria bacterium]|uniref:energy transducer TonB n=1 Tax=Pseudomaricurvus alcaniphilus TaxID=1166482 RepID=UPI001409BC72|nr:energy transducer TonB [Pseudomaricurvus alcaniphilus]MBR9909485.1 TonB family protein [Gammaproteobacteria bacterium]NHN37110.1 TonB family protein [Pseudomaricurvus alcaniphilus]
MIFARVLIAAALAAGTTFGLLFLMHALIEANNKPPEEVEERKVADILMPERQIETKYDTEKPDKPEEVDEPPPDMPEPEFDQPDVNPDALSMAAPKVNPNLSVKGVGGFGGDGEYLPIVKVQPQYPSRALSRGLEGYAIVEFTVTTNGSVRDPVTIEGMAGRKGGELSESSIFNSAAEKAALKFKYKPRVIDGEAVEVPGVRNKITFTIAD